MPAPTLLQTSGNTWTATAGTARTTGSISWFSGNLIVVIGCVEDDGDTLTTPTATGLTFTLLSGFPSTTAATVKTYVWSAVAATSGSSTVSSTASIAGIMANIQAYVYSGSTGIGANAKTNTGSTNTISLTRTGANSAVIFFGGDWGATADTTVTANPVSGGAQNQAVEVSTRATMFAFNWTDQGAAGTTSYGISGFAATDVFSKVAIEILGNTAPAATLDATATLDSTGFSAGASFNLSHTTASGASIMILVAAIWQSVAGTGTISGITYNGNSFTKIRNIVNGVMNAEAWYLLDPTAGTASIVVNTTGDTRSRKLASYTFSGANSFISSDATGTVSPITNSITTTLDSQVIIDCVSHFSANPLTAASGQTTVLNITTSGVTGASSHRIAYGILSHNAAWTKAGADPWAEVILALENITPPSGVVVGWFRA